jgi:hypothetical protein
MTNMCWHCVCMCWCLRLDSASGVREELLCFSINVYLSVFAYVCSWVCLLLVYMRLAVCVLLLRYCVCFCMCLLFVHFVCLLLGIQTFNCKYSTTWVFCVLLYVFLTCILVCAHIFVCVGNKWSLVYAYVCARVFVLSVHLSVCMRACA